MLEKQLTKAEEQIMQQLWLLGPSFLRDLVESFGGIRPHQNTVATILKTLANKGFVEVETIGRNHLYKAAISREDYSKRTVSNLVQQYFKGSFSQMVSFFAREKNISVTELEQIIEQLKKK